MHVESKEFVLRFELRAEFPEDYEGDEDGYAWAAAFPALAQSLVGAVVRTVAAQPGWKIRPTNRGRSSEDEVSFVVAPKLADITD
jgi:hypothetical protein